MKFSIKHLLVVIAFVSVCAAWWFDRQTMNAQITELNNRDLVRVVDLGYDPAFSIADSTLSVLPKWTDAKLQPPVSASDARQVANKILGQISELETRKDYGDIWLQTIRLVPIVDPSDKSQPQADWCYVLDFVGYMKMVDEITTQRGDVEVTIMPNKLYRAAVLMDGTIHSCRFELADKRIHDDLLAIYPESAAFEKDYVAASITKRIEKNENRTISIGGKEVARKQLQEQIRKQIRNKIQQSQTGNPKADGSGNKSDSEE